MMPNRRVQLRPDRRFLCPGGVLVASGERTGGFLEGRCVACLLVPRNTGPVQRLGSGVGVRELLVHTAKQFCGFVPLLLLKRDPGATENQLGEEVIGGEKSLEAMARHSGTVER